ncbi:GGDEF domain-containing protein [Deinococcus apachensis]|uniref:GGDEF domain-containing protein n=1 Tax=Deinococcus apachensis TaxID=309886 RepID=UPI00037710FC|nr:diguanylate cyclase [Deinococcus apachensis]
MLSALFVNFSILVTFTSIGGLTHTATERHHTLRLALRYVLSVVGGLILIGYGVPLAEGVRVDFRQVPVALAGLFGGPLPAFAVALPLALYRAWLGGEGAVGGISGLLTTAAVASVFHTRLHHSHLTWRDAWAPFATFALANLSLLLVPGRGPALFQTAYLPLTLLQGLGLLVTFAVIAVRFDSVGHSRTLHILAYRDALTGLLNRRQFDLDLADLPADGHVHLLLLDLDHFKRLNDTLGHGFGDVVLRELGGLLTVHTRGTDRVYRVGGEEFAVLLHSADPEVVAGVANRLRDLVRRQLGARAGRPDWTLTFSAGLARHDTGPSSTFETADARLYEAKRSGRDRVVGEEVGPSLTEVEAPAVRLGSTT